jgi:hypothetical protein
MVYRPHAGYDLTSPSRANCHHNVYLVAFLRHVHGDWQIATEETMKISSASRAESCGRDWLVTGWPEPLASCGRSDDILVTFQRLNFDNFEADQLIALSCEESSARASCQ